jgi:hypothetical protein
MAYASMPTSFYIEYWSYFKPIYKNDSYFRCQFGPSPWLSRNPFSVMWRKRLATLVLSEVEGSGNLSA